MEQFEESLPPVPINEVLTTLNQNQLTAAVSKALIIRTTAGPGTGKTKTMEARVANLLSNKQDPARVLALSFTNESANEFKERIQKTCGYLGHIVQTGTFHAFFNKLLKRFQKHPFFKDKLGYSDGFFVIDDEDSKRLMKESRNHIQPGLKELLDALEVKNSDLLSMMSKIRAQAHNASTYAKTLISDANSVKQWQSLKLEVEGSSPESVSRAVQFVSQNPKLREFLLVTVWDEYSRRCRVCHGMDFDDVLLNSYFLLKFNKDVARKVAHSLDHVLVDEYQDTNLVQALLLQTLRNANPALNLFLVGDGRQAIYDFRGSDVRLMTNAEAYYGDITDYELDTNYRSSSQLIAFSNIFAKDMPDQVTLGQLSPGDAPPIDMSNEFHEFENDIEEASWCVDRIKKLIDHGEHPSDIYVMYRTRTAARRIEECLKANSLNYSMVGEKNFYERMEVRDAIAFFRTVTRPKDVLAWSRLCECMPVAIRGIWLREKHLENPTESPKQLILSRAKGKNEATINDWLELYEAAKTTLCSTQEAYVADFMIDNPHIALSPTEVSILINTDPAAKAEFDRWYNDYIEEVMNDLLYFYLQSVAPVYLKQDTSKPGQKEASDPEKVTHERLDRVEQVFTEVKLRLKEGNELSDVIDELITRDSSQANKQVAGVKLLTGHASKGLEAKHCFIVGCDTAIWQRNGLEANPKELEELGRLYYVMITRAKAANYLTSAKSRWLHDKVVPSKPFPLIAQHIKQARTQGLITIDEHDKQQSARVIQSHSHRKSGTPATPPIALQRKSKLLERLKSNDNMTISPSLSP